MTRTLRIAIICAGLWLMTDGPARATCTGLGCTCSIAASALDFGDYNPVSGADVDATGNVSVTCGATLVGADISYEVSLSSGGSGDELNRAMANGGNNLSYNLYTTAARATVWGDGVGGTDVIANSYLLSVINSQTDDFPVYGRIPGAQNVPAGAYSDTIIATVAF